MKAIFPASWIRLALALATGGALVLAPATGRAGDQQKPAKKPTSAKSSQAAKVSTKAAKTQTKASKALPSEEVFTGSLIPQKVRANDAAATSLSPLVVIDRKAIDRTGASTVSEVLARTAPGIR
jgi:hypothetical protein